ncbi:MAG TPA: PKD domain-containing protein, partial [Acidimicrobiales bacterium]|nr:PKD domain-containing protein [Acidimicrobiales bacterium]
MGLPRGLVYSTSDWRVYTATTGLGAEGVAYASLKAKPHWAPATYEWAGVASVVELDGSIVASDRNELRVLHPPPVSHDPKPVATSVVSYAMPAGALAASAQYAATSTSTADALNLLLAAAQTAQSPAVLTLADLKSERLTTLGSVTLPTTAAPTDVVIDSKNRVAFVGTRSQLIAVDLSAPRVAGVSLSENGQSVDSRILGSSVTGLTGADKVRLTPDSKRAYVVDEVKRLVQVVALVPQPLVDSVSVSAGGKSEDLTIVAGQSTIFTPTVHSQDCATLNYAWAFGDGQTSTLASPSHRFATPDDYFVTLTVSCPGSAAPPVQTTFHVAVADVSFAVGAKVVGVLGDGSARQDVPATYTLTLPPLYKVVTGTIDLAPLVKASVVSVPLSGFFAGKAVAVSIPRGTIVGPPNGVVAAYLVVNKGRVDEVRSGPSIFRTTTSCVPHDSPDAPVLQASSAVEPTLILPVRNFESTAKGTAAGDPPPSPTEQPIALADTCEICVSRSGLVTVTVGGMQVAGAKVTVQSDDTLKVEPAQGLTLLTVSGTALTTPIGPAGAGAKAVVELTPADGSAAVQQEVAIETLVKDSGPAAVGHTFVKDVSLTDGHLFKQFEDIRVPSTRGPPLVLLRSYNNRGFEDGPLGEGWAVANRSYVLPEGSLGLRFMVVGGDGGGQVFTCDGSGSCKAQRGLHGTFWKTNTGAVTWRSLSGVEYRYGPLNSFASPPRYPLVAIVDPVGREASVEYGDASEGGEPERIYDTGNRRFLQLRYGGIPGHSRLRLVEAELMRNPSAPAVLAPGTQGQPLGLCVRYGFDTNGMLNKVERFENGCGADLMRAEGYTYVTTSDAELRNNLETITDANGAVTRFVYLPAGSALPGGEGYQYQGNSAERVQQVIEPAYGAAPGATTSFGYSLSDRTTRVTNPRGFVTTYTLDAYGSVTITDRGGGVVSTTDWDVALRRPLVDHDPLGRSTTYHYDSAGRVIERDIDGAAGMAPAVDGDGSPAGAIVEAWTFHPTFG